MRRSWGMGSSCGFYFRYGTRYRAARSRETQAPPAVYARYRYCTCAEWVQPRQPPRGRTSRTPAGSRQRRLRSGSLPPLAGLRPIRTPLRAWDRSGWLFRQTRIVHLESLRFNRASLLALTTVHGARISRNGCLWVCQPTREGNVAVNFFPHSVVKLGNPPVGTRTRLNLRRGLLSYSGFSAVCVPFGSRAASPTGTCIAGGTVR